LSDHGTTAGLSGSEVGASDTGAPSTLAPQTSIDRPDPTNTRRFTQSPNPQPGWFIHIHTTFLNQIPLPYLGVFAVRIATAGLKTGAETARIMPMRIG
jgi:hypothetical protein